MYERIVDALFANSSAAGAAESRAALSSQDEDTLQDAAQLAVSSDGIAAAGVPVAATSSVQLAIARAVERVCHTHGCVPMQSRVVCCCMACGSSLLSRGSLLH